MDEIKKNNKFNILIVIVFIVFIIIFLIIFYIKKNSNNIENFKQPSKTKPLNTQELIMEQIKNFNKEKARGEDTSPDFLDKHFFDEIKQSGVINDIKKSIDTIQLNLKHYKEEDVKEIKEKLEYIMKKINNETTPQLTSTVQPSTTVQPTTVQSTKNPDSIIHVETIEENNDLKEKEDLSFSSTEPMEIITSFDDDTKN